MLLGQQVQFTAGDNLISTNILYRQRHLIVKYDACEMYKAVALCILYKLHVEYIEIRRLKIAKLKVDM